MAKSKRSHTQHHQPKKPPKTTSSSSSATSTSTAAKKDGRERKKASLPTPSLPSNWDRYEDENLEDEIEVVRFHSDSYQPSPLADSESKSAVDVDIDVFKPKSKGADFRDLIAQAKESRSYYSPSFDDKLPGNFSPFSYSIFVICEIYYILIAMLFIAFQFHFCFNVMEFF